MKQHLALLLLLITTCVACKKDSNQSGNTDSALTGIWVKPSINAATASDKESIEFSSDGDVTINRYYSNTPTQQIVKYSYRYTGKYRVTGSGMLQLYDMQLFANNSTDPYVAIDKLTSKGSSANQQYLYKLDNFNTTLTWTVVCPPNASCIGAQQYTKQ
ncbi:hypothetical protein [Mucilaginibacter sp. CSA2-8R]|uniref:hypothetical protein n=1 Tax=Mucilaginibacter sp. CSA2-8R TaxID=3141542 RepID=UPI00315D3D79